MVTKILNYTLYLWNEKKRQSLSSKASAFIKAAALIKSRLHSIVCMRVNVLAEGGVSKEELISIMLLVTLLYHLIALY